MTEIAKSNPTSTALQSKSSSGTKAKSYEILSPNKAGIGRLKADPLLPATSKEVLPALSLMLAHASNRKSLNQGEFNLLTTALQKFEVTTDEAMEAFWKAYADPYVSQGRIEFRHLWKHIEVIRKGESRKSYTFEEMATRMDKENIPQEAFTMIEERDVKGRKKWALK